MASIEISPDEVEHAVHNVWSRYQQVEASASLLNLQLRNAAELFAEVPELQNAINGFHGSRHNVVARALHVVDSGAHDVIDQVANLIKRDVDAALQML